MVGTQQLHFGANALLLLVIFLKALWEGFDREIAAFKPAVVHSFQ